jgi:hypothetical protein
MMRWVRFAGSVTNGTPVLLSMLLVMVCAWFSAGEIYGVVVWAHGSSGFAGSVLVSLNVLCSWLLVFYLAGLLRDLRELRLPKQRQVLLGALTVILGLLFVAPCVLVWLLGGITSDVLMVAAGAALGTAGALLWKFRSRTGNVPGVRGSASGFVPSVPMQLPSPWRAVRVALGPPYAPASWQRRGIELALLCAAVAGAPLVALLYEGSLQPRVFPFVFRTAEFVGFLTAIVLCWIWPLTRLLAMFNPQRGALTELALLPRLGDGRQQLRRLYLVALSVPAAGLFLLLASALLLVTLQHLPKVVYMRLVVEFLLIPLITLPILIAQLAKPDIPARFTVAALMGSQMWTFSLLVWSGLWGLDAAGSLIGHRLRWLIAGVVLAALIVIVGFSLHALRKILQRPNPFVEVSS